MCHVKQSTFAERFAYARWIAHLVRREPPTLTAIAEAVGRSQPWMTKWARSETPPPNYEFHRPLADYLEVSETWLIRGEGEPPFPRLWLTWRNPVEAPAAVHVSPSAAKAIVKDAPTADPAAKTNQQAGHRTRR